MSAFESSSEQGTHHLTKLQILPTILSVREASFTEGKPILV